MFQTKRFSRGSQFTLYSTLMRCLVSYVWLLCAAMRTGFKCVLWVILLSQSHVVLAQDTTRYLTVYGDIDPRMQVSILSWFRSTDASKAACNEDDWTTASSIPSLTVRGETKLTGQFTVHIPLTITGVDECGWEYSLTRLKTTRIADHEGSSYTQLTLLSNRQKASHTEWGGITGQSSTGKIPTSATTAKRHYFLGEQLDLACHTKAYKTTGNVKFKCLPRADQEWSGGVETLDDLTVHIHARVDESQHTFIHYQPKLKVTMMDRFMQFWQQLFR